MKQGDRKVAVPGCLSGSPVLHCRTCGENACHPERSEEPGSPDAELLPHSLRSGLRLFALRMTARTAL